MKSTFNSKSERQGSTLLECTVALGLLAAAFTFGVQALGWSAAQRRAGDQRHVAIQEAANCLEQVRVLDWADLNDERLSQIKLSEVAQARLPSAELKITTEKQNEPDAVRVRVEVLWPGRSSGSPLRVGLVTWRYNTNRAE